MKPFDIAKAAGVGFLIVVANLLITVVIVFLYAQLFDPGHPTAYYNPIAAQIGAWSAPIGGAMLFFAAAYALARKQPSRNPFLFAVACFVAYVMIDGGIGAMMGSLNAMLSLHVAVSLLVILLAALAGARLASSGYRNRAAL